MTCKLSFTILSYKNISIRLRKNWKGNGKKNNSEISESYTNISHFSENSDIYILKSKVKKSF